MIRGLYRSQHALRSHTHHHGLKATALITQQALFPLLRRHLSTAQQDAAHDAFTDSFSSVAVVRPALPLSAVPLSCPGCGAPSQNVEASAAGYFSEREKRGRGDRRAQLDAVYAAALGRGSLDGAQVSEERPSLEKGTPVCDRCHNLVNQSSGQSIVHPTTESIRSIIEDSPYKQNHIYHVLDAADFPMSLIPNLTAALELPRLRTQNRRSKSTRYIRDRVAEVSFIITRADLLAPKKEQVDKLMFYIQQVLRDALGRAGQNVRLGNIRLVSAKRGWWTASVKEEIFRRGGAGWMVGKVNVGKSALVEVVYPKGRMDDAGLRKLRADAKQERDEAAKAQLIEDIALEQEAPTPPVLPGAPFEGEDPLGMPDDGVSAISNAEDPADISSANTTVDIESTAYQPTTGSDNQQDIKEEDDYLFDESEDSLLPPAPQESAYPTMPTVSALPGTTASPIRIPFGNGKGELIDLPGIERSTLDTYVVPEVRKEMVMKYRIVPEQQSVKPGQSLLLGGLIRITPKTDELVFLMYGFLPAALKPHVTSTDKAIAIQTGSFAETGEAYGGHVKTNATDAAKLSTKSAGTYALRWDVTRARAGPVTSKVAGKMKPENLPYFVYGLDLLIEGVGWVEIVAQVRRRRTVAEHDDMREVHLPEIEVFSPKGQFVGMRQPLNGWVIGGPKKTPAHAQRARPRKSMSFHRRVAGGRAGSPMASF